MIIELDSSEPPILDGSARPFVELIMESGPIEQEQDRDYLELKEPICVGSGNRSIVAIPHDGLKITCTSSDDRGAHVQHLSVDIDSDFYTSNIAPARTFTLYEDIEKLLKLGKIRGGSLDSAIVIKGDKIIKKTLTLKEFVRGRNKVALGKKDLVIGFDMDNLND